jgi:hypothetical protein
MGCHTTYTGFGIFALQNVNNSVTVVITNTGGIKRDNVTANYGHVICNHVYSLSIINKHLGDPVVVGIAYKPKG